VAHNFFEINPLMPVRYGDFDGDLAVLAAFRRGAAGWQKANGQGIVENVRAIQ
jgi:hypothetical protein